ncbi:hypothetical protein CEXT_734971 [Caerostris extrusa]|uniref:Uncharacterized protein n=1 Tax=Caerostris extrusa TaxID=172846 RepID=A0AAV4Y6G8_CAEEX|nr:hypothetical protein CEXT_734971 [Caerostris extrusa]
MKWLGDNLSRISGNFVRYPIGVVEGSSFVYEGVKNGDALGQNVLHLSLKIIRGRSLDSNSSSTTYYNSFLRPLSSSFGSNEKEY